MKRGGTSSPQRRQSNYRTLMNKGTKLKYFVYGVLSLDIVNALWEHNKEEATLVLFTVALLFGASWLHDYLES